MRRAVWLLLGGVLVIGLLILFVFPTRTLIDQQHQISSTEHQIAVLDRENATLRHRAAALEQPGTIEQIARQQYGLVMPGQRAYAVVGASTAGNSGAGG